MLGSAAAALLSVAALLLYRFDPSLSGLFPPCPFHWLTGLDCPGCGALRAGHLLLHGQFAAALGKNPLLLLAVPFVVVLLLQRRWAYRPWTARAALVVLLAFGVLRNIPLWPFVLLHSG